MTQAAGTPALAGEPGGRPARRGPGPPPWPWAGRAWVAVVPALVTLGVVAYQAGGPSLWRDEGATLAAVRRTLPQMMRMLGHVDAVHGTYYLLMWFWVRLAGTGVVALRLPSMLAMAATAGVLTLLGQRLVSGRAGLAAGLVYAALPIVSRYAQDARPYAMAAALATIASYLLLRATGPGARRRRWMVGYAVTLGLLGLSNLFALLLIPVHAIALAVWQRRGGGPAEPAPRSPPGPAGRGSAARAARAAPGRPRSRVMARDWAVAVVAAVVVVSPVAVLSWGQRSQVSWIKPPKLASVTGLGGLIGGQNLLIAVLSIFVIAVVFAQTRWAPGRRDAWPPGLVGLAVPWAALPAALLLAASLIHPYYSLRYVIFCVPAVALLAGTALAALGRVAAVVMLALIVAVAVPEQARARLPGSHGENLRELSMLVAGHAHRGDAIIFAGRNTREFEAAYPGPYRKLRDVGLGETATASATLTGTNAPAAVVRARLATVRRLWAVETGTARALRPPFLHGMGFRARHRWVVTGIWLVLLTRHRG